MKTISILNIETKLMQWRKAKDESERALNLFAHMVASLYLSWNKLRTLLKSQSRRSTLLVRNRILIVNILVRPQQTRWWCLAIAIMTKWHRIIRQYKQSLLHFWYTYVHSQLQLEIATRFNNESIIACKSIYLIGVYTCCAWGETNEIYVAE